MIFSLDPHLNFVTCTSIHVGGSVCILVYNLLSNLHFGERESGRLSEARSAWGNGS